ncbi:MAG: hypothetical protein NZ988_01250 [Thaumarchaeota archaeon]|nr:hypothetical protein [Candidatus Calditenuaceae archaeon]MDW8186660.1 hypothetical protein [Nitrososphaerota archaeon]
MDVGQLALLMAGSVLVIMGLALSWTPTASIFRRTAGSAGRGKLSARGKL